LRVQNRLTDALLAFEIIIRDHPEYDDVVFAWSGAAETLRDMWRLDEALGKYEEATQKFPEEPAVACGRAAVLTDLGHLDLAYQAYSHILDRFGNQAVALNGRATVLREMGNLSESLAAYLAVMGLFPDDSVASCGAAEVMRLQGNLSDALAGYAKVITDFPRVTVATFPTNIVVNFKRDDLQFELKESFGETATGILSLPGQYGSAWVIDGQHRLYGYAYASRQRESDHSVVSVLAYENLPSPECEVLRRQIRKSTSYRSTPVRLRV
jgi:tetratricopeptide (TPR) repeat protein